MLRLHRGTHELGVAVRRAPAFHCVDQRSFGSLFHRGYIRYEKSRGGFILTNLGKRARQVFGDRPTAVPYFFSVTVIAGDSCGLSVCFVNSPIGSAVDVERT